MRRYIVILLLLISGVGYGQQDLRGTLTVRKRKPLEHVIIGEWRLDYVRHDHKITNRPGWMIAFDNRGITTEIVNQDTIFGSYKIIANQRVKMVNRRCVTSKEPRPSIDFTIQDLKTDTVTFIRRLSRFEKEDWVYVRKL